MFGALSSVASSMVGFNFFYFVPAAAVILSIIKIIRNFF